MRDEVEKAHRTASRALEEVDGILFVVEEPADSIVVRGATGTMEFVRPPTLCAEIMAGSVGLRPCARGPGGGLPGRARGGESPVGGSMTAFTDHLAAQMAKLRQAGTYKEELVLQSAQGPARAGRRPRGRDADLEQLPRLRQPPAHPGGPEEGRRPLGRRARLRSLHLRHAGAPQGARGRDRVLLRHRRHDPLHDLLGRQRGPLRRRARRARRPLLGRAQPRLDHRRRAPVQGQAVPRPAQRHEGVRRRCSPEDTDLAVPAHDHRRRLLHGGRAGGPARARPRSASGTASSSPSTTRTPRASSARPAAAPARSRASSTGSRSPRERSARRWARPPAAS